TGADRRALEAPPVSLASRPFRPLRDRIRRHCEARLPIPVPYQFAVALSPQGPGLPPPTRVSSARLEGPSPVQARPIHREHTSRGFLEWIGQFWHPRTLELDATQRS